jgi:hypothetical protein
MPNPDIRTETGYRGPAARLFRGERRDCALIAAKAIMDILVSVLMAWLVANLDLPQTQDLPRVEIVSAAKMAEVRYSRLASIHADRVASEAGRSAPTDVGQDVHAMYDDFVRTIYLPKGWSATSPADVSLLVHELVHHLQNVAAEKFDCPQAREKSAYRAQSRWLELFGTSLEREFEIDAMTLLVRSNCMR